MPFSDILSWKAQNVPTTVCQSSGVCQFFLYHAVFSSVFLFISCNMLNPIVPGVVFIDPSGFS